jgi:hypothetical protein
VQDTPDRKLAIPGLGLGATDHAPPFHDSTRVCGSPDRLTTLPTATQSVALTQDTLER